MSDEPQTLAEALGADPDEISEQLRRDFDRIREAERQAHIAASQIWLA